MVQLVTVQSLNEINELANIARTIWNEYFPSLIGQKQVDYMLEKFQSIDAIGAQIADGYLYFLITEEDNVIGYIGIVSKTNTQTMQISKFYILREWRNKGCAKEIIIKISTLAMSIDCNKFYLTVNKYNSSSIAAYQKLGFIIIGELVINIGNGFIMDDFEMEKKIT
ncbi:MAG: RimJ/RimL family protein N-acetyltransferase [Gammaproteobacteria bacterium]|jgi:RimJ/RimL family protein N-acetyltransferase